MDVCEEPPSRRGRSLAQIPSIHDVECHKKLDKQAWFFDLEKSVYQKVIAELQKSNRDLQWIINIFSSQFIKIADENQIALLLDLIRVVDSSFDIHICAKSPKGEWLEKTSDNM